MINRHIRFILFFFFIFIFFSKKCFTEDTHSNLIAILESNYPLEFTFQQKYQNETQDGWMVIYGNGMARTEFAPPNNNLIIADGKWIMFYDPAIDRTTYIPLDKGILSTFFNPKSLSKDKFFKVKEEQKNTKIIFTLDFNVNEANQKIIFYFDEKSKNLLGWRLYENATDFIEVKVMVLKKFKISDDNKLKEFFKMKEKNSKIEKMYLGPYKNRKVKKYLRGGKLN
mgnify:CR=1 FL=1